MCSETSPETLSKDLGQQDVEKNVDNLSGDNKALMLKPSSDFEFIVGSNLGHEPCSADELFSNGLILPTQGREGSASLSKHVKRYHPNLSVASSPLRPPILCPEISDKVLKKGIVSGSETESNTSGEYPRSSSLKNEAKKSLLCSLSLLPRSNSVGAVPNRKKTSTMSKDKQSSQRTSSFMTRTFSFSSNSSNHSTHQKTPAKKNYGMKYGNGVHQTSHNQVLNIPSSSIGIGASNLFGFGCLLPGRKDHRSK